MNLTQYLCRSSGSQLIRELGVFSMPLYYITTRDSFAYDLVEKISYIEMYGRKVKKIEYFFEPDNFPQNFKYF